MTYVPSTLAVCVILATATTLGADMHSSAADLPPLAAHTTSQQLQQPQHQPQAQQQTQQQHFLPQAQNMFSLFSEDSLNSNTIDGNSLSEPKLESGYEAEIRTMPKIQAVDKEDASADMVLDTEQPLSVLNSNMNLESSKRASPMFFGRKRASPMFFGKKRASPMFFGKKRASPKFFGKKRASPMFFGKKRASPMFFGKKRASPMFFGKKRARPMFFGKRSINDQNVISDETSTQAHSINKRSAELVAPLPQAAQSSSQAVAKRAYNPSAGSIDKRFTLYRQPGQFSLSTPYMSTKEFKETFRRSDPYFMGKRANEMDQDAHFDLKLIALKRQAPRFFGKRGAPTPRFFGKRGMVSPRYIGKRQPRFFGKRGSPRFFGKRELDETSDDKFGGIDLNEESEKSVDARDSDLEELLRELARLVELERLLATKRNRQGNLGRRELSEDDLTPFS